MKYASVLVCNLCNKSMEITRADECSFLSWMRENSHYYIGPEYRSRFDIWLSNKRYVQEHNSRNGITYRLTLNKLACLSPSEYCAMLGTISPGPKEDFKHIINPQKLSVSNVDFIDWRKKGVVGLVKNQLSCGSCWAFATIGCQEINWAIYHNELLSLSEQNLVDCCTNCKGCAAGWPLSAVDYVIQNQESKFMLDSDYPYINMQTNCRFNLSNAVSNVNGYEIIPAQQPETIKSYITEKGAVILNLNAEENTFRLYYEGIYDDELCPNKLTHSIVAIGFGTENDIPYWILRNSWGEKWGEDGGYMRIIRNINRCGCEEKPSYINCE